MSPPSHHDYAIRGLVAAEVAQVEVGVARLEGVGWMVDGKERPASRKAYRDELHRRGLCVSCVELHSGPTLRCHRCQRRMYVLARIRKVERALAYHRQEMEHLLREKREWKGKPKSQRFV